MPIRPAELADLPALVALENAAFASDRLSRRSLRYYISAPSAALIVCERRGCLAGYSLVAFRKGSRVARLYAIAVGRASRGLKLGAVLLKASEKAARDRGAAVLYLEVRVRNRRAVALYEENGYRFCDRIEDYYEDGATALCYEKQLWCSWK
ncbi:MAG: GNAT family N-acetyltransferase [Beijerinckiaceae bacterium]